MSKHTVSLRVPEGLLQKVDKLRATKSGALCPRTSVILEAMEEGLKVLATKQRGL